MNLCFQMSLLFRTAEGRYIIKEQKFLFFEEKLLGMAYWVGQVICSSVASAYVYAYVVNDYSGSGIC